MTPVKEVVGFLAFLTGSVVCAALVAYAIRGRFDRSLDRRRAVALAVGGFAWNGACLGLLVATRFDSVRSALPLDALRPFFALAPAPALMTPSAALLLAQSSTPEDVRLIRSLLRPVGLSVSLLAGGFLARDILSAWLGPVENDLLRALFALTCLSALAVACLPMVRALGGPDVLNDAGAGERDSAPQPTRPARLVVYTPDGVGWLSHDRIVARELERGLVFATTADGRYATRFVTLTHALRALSDIGFVRVHRQAAVRLDSAVRLVLRPNRTAVVRLASGHEVPVSRARLSAVRRSLAHGGPI